MLILQIKNLRVREVMLAQIVRISGMGLGLSLARGRRSATTVQKGLGVYFWSV